MSSGHPLVGLQRASERLCMFRLKIHAGCSVNWKKRGRIQVHPSRPVIHKLGGRVIRGSINFQVNQVFLKSGIFCPGESKHAAKDVARQAGAQTWADLGKSLNIYSYGTAQVYKDTWHQACHWIKDNLGLETWKISRENT